MLVKSHIAAAIIISSVILYSFTAWATAGEPVQPVYPNNIPTMRGSPEGNQWQITGAQRQHYNLHITSSARNGGFTIDDRLIISNHKGKVLLDVRNVDPVFFAQLPPGHYMLTATSGSEQKVKNVSISAHKTKDINFVW